MSTPPASRSRSSWLAVVACATLAACNDGGAPIVVGDPPDAGAFDDWYQPGDGAATDDREPDDPRDAGPIDVPVAPIDVPVAPIDVPVAPIDVPVAPIDVPVAPIDVPVAPIDVPVAPIDVPVAPIDVPVAPIDVPVAPAPPRFTTVFSTRRADNGTDTAVEDAVVDLIRRAVPGSRVRVALYTFTRAGPSAALIAAARRGVDVRIVLDGGAGSTAGSEVATLRAGLGADRVTLCGAPGTSCNGSGIMHHKTFLFSALDDGSREVVMQASHNLTTTQLSMHNNAVIVRGDAALFAGYERTWNDLRRDADVANYYRIDDGDRGTRAYFFPRTDGDTAVSIVNNVDCVAGSRVRVAMAFFTDARLAVAQALAARRRAGCAVEVLIGDAEIRAGASVLSTLRGAGVAVTLYPARAGGWTIHSKYLLVESPYAGSAAPRRLVFTGSHNWTGPALDANDETLLRVEDDGVYAAFVGDWSRMRAAAVR